MAKRLNQENADIVEEKCISNDEKKFVLAETENLQAWNFHYDKLLNEEFSWNADSLSEERPVQGPAKKITTEMV